ncbi:MAG: hypothetical protein GY722_00705 [bacterium]|nr:hypothetical protein [bacterium]
MEVTPALVLAMWTAGAAFGVAAVSYWAIVGPGYGLLLSAVALSLVVVPPWPATSQSVW